jgi:uncharacterized protein (DUF302 family)
MPHWQHTITIVTFCFAPHVGLAADAGLITKQSNHSVADTIQRFEAAVNANAANGWMVFTEIDHAAAAQKVGLQMRPRTVIVFGNPKLGTPNMQKAATLAIDVPPKALVWEDDQGKVWLTYNSAEYLQNVIYPRHGLPSNPEAAKNAAVGLAKFADSATQ